MDDLISELLDYNLKMNERVITHLTGEIWPQPHRLFLLINHVVSTHHIWNQRIDNESPKYGVWGEALPGELALLNQKNTAQSKEIWARRAADELIQYTNSRGEEFENTVQDILFHVINHSNYHRAQIAVEVRLQGGIPLATDYIFYKRVDME